jgi:hypothetical protein
MQQPVEKWGGSEVLDRAGWGMMRRALLEGLEAAQMG